MPLISVVVDNYNYAQWLPDALDSVLRQTLTDFECIVVDDGSTDGSQSIILDYAKRSSAIVPVFKKNGGQASAFNAGFAIATGEIIAFLDSDDYWFPQKLARIVEAHEKSRIVQHYLTPNGQGIYRKIQPNLNRSEALVAFGYMYNHSPTSGLSFTREVLAPFFPLVQEEEMRGHVDGCLLMLALTQSNVLVLEEVLGLYRIHGSNLNAGKTEHGTAARNIAGRQIVWANRQLATRGRKLIPANDRAWYRHLLDISRPSLGEHFAIYGTEGAALRLSQAIEERGDVEVWGYADSNPEKWGTQLLGKKIVSPKELSGFASQGAFSRILIASSAVEAIAGVLEGLNFGEEQIIRLPL